MERKEEGRERELPEVGERRSRGDEGKDEGRGTRDPAAEQDG